MTALEWIRERSTPEPNTGCWLWLRALSRDGYAKTGHGFAHRLSVRASGRELPAGLEVDHRCRVRSCVNPAHLEVVTHRENTMRGDTVPARNGAKERCPRGHKLVGENLRGGQKHRRCRACFNERQRERRAKFGRSDRVAA